ncbi:PhzF family phenazine biosynthesis protein [Jatrophihabitans sp. GAS493]|uniref:PhzF family phenazine biosynthesis protein n=1 Tax=Jatrophihabitans sp. GAS493 TaxID=1907575 RepID=UPI000BB802B7|nr:PhzF family phenazine biosynthesis isomerase [Jatrophihabitans sp. GAS493]SOD74551.1 PhzF family phenazine biosynthesis protein [Jatrophihabitans sp. GAS493]
MTGNGDVLRYSAFTTDVNGGNPAGVVLDATGLAESQMQQIAADLGYSETAFLVPHGERSFTVRYFAPLAEVPFCGHATIAAAVAYAERAGTGTLRLDTQVGPVPVTTATTATTADDGGLIAASLTSVTPATKTLADEDLSELLAALGWSAADLDPSLPPGVGYAGAWHPILATSTRARLADLDYDFDRLSELMALRRWTTVDLIWRESAHVFHARNPFPPGGIVEDPATGAAAAALGGWLRAMRLVELPATITVHQGVDMGRPSLITVGIDADEKSGIVVSGSAVELS